MFRRSRRHRLALVGAMASALVAVGMFAGAAPATSEAPPQNTSKPTITGNAQEGQTLTGHNGGWTGQPTRYDFQWLRCDGAGNACADIAGANKQTYLVAKADIGHRLRVRVTAFNKDGSASARSDATAVVKAAPATAPSNTSPPTISGTPVAGQTLTAQNGSWTGTQPITFTYQWQRCDRSGSSCAAIVGATSRTYTLTAADVGATIRVAVTAKNAAGSRTSTTAPTAAVQPAGPEGQIKLPNGAVSIPASSVAPPERLIVDAVRFSPNPVRSRQVPITVRAHVIDTRGFVVRGALVFVRSTPLVTTATEQPTQVDGWVTFTLQPRASIPLRNGWNVQFFLRARKEGDNVLAGVSSRRLVQVRTAAPAR